MITFLGKEKQMKIAHIEMPLDVEDVDTPFIYNVDIKIAESSLEEVMEQCSQNQSPTGISITEVRFNLFLSPTTLKLAPGVRTLFLDLFSKARLGCN